MIATVTARAANSTVPDRDDAVDFCVTEGDTSFEVTLLVDGQSGLLDVWGDLENWCSDPAAFTALGFGAMSEIVSACRAAV